jgi:hypothetical protein
MTTQQLYRRDLKPGDRFRYGESDNGLSACWTVVAETCDRHDDDNIPPQIASAGYRVCAVVRAPLPSAPPVPARKGRVGMRVRHHTSHRELLLARCDEVTGYWDAMHGVVHVEGVVRDAAIGAAWLIIDAPAATRAEAVQLRRDDLLPGDQFRYGDPDGNPACWEVVDSTHDRSIRGVKDYEVSGRLEWNVCNIVRAGTKGIRAPVATPEVVRAGIRLSQCRVGDVVRNARNEFGDESFIFNLGTATITSLGAGRVDFTCEGRPCFTEYGERYVVDAVSTAPTAPAVNATALRRYEGAQQAEGTKYMRDADRREGSAAFTAAVSLRLAARAEERRIATQQHCQPNYAGGDDVDE